LVGCNHYDVDPEKLIATDRPRRQKEQPTWRQWAPPLAIAAAFLVAFFATINNYGITWDEPENFYTGARSLKFIETGDYEWLRFPRESGFVSQLNWKATDGARYTRELDAFRRASAHDFEPGHQQRFVHRELAFAYPFTPVANTLAAFTDQIFDQWLGLLDPIAAHHAAIGLLWAVFIVAIYRFTRKLAGVVGATVTSAIIALTPRLWGPVHNNVKDLPEAAFFGLTLIAFHKGVTEDRPPWVLAGGALGGIAVATKLNGAFVFIAGLVWLLLARGSLPEVSKRCRIAMWCAPLVSAFAFFISWPYLWAHPVTRTTWALRYGLAVARSVPSVRAGYAIVYVIATTPLIVTALILIALGRLWRLSSSPGRPGLLLLLWALVPIARASVPGTGFYDGIRQFIEYLPAVAIVAGIGAKQATDLVGSYRRRTNRRFITLAPSWVVAVAIVAAALVPQVVADVRLHPYEDVFFNRLIGGPAGAHRRLHWATDYWGNSYLRFVRWANRHLERGSTVVVPIAPFLTSYDGLRPDINVTQTLPRTNRGQPTYLAYITRKESYESLIALYDSRRPLYKVDINGLTVLKAYRVSPTG
jgi:hypothetical protein